MPLERIAAELSQADGGRAYVSLTPRHPTEPIIDVDLDQAESTDALSMVTLAQEWNFRLDRIRLQPNQITKSL